jgi:AraC family transcriptional activator FtrA
VVAALIGSRVAAFELGVVHEVFGLDRAECDDRPYDLRVVAAYGSPVPVNIYSSGGKPTSSVGSWSISTPWDIDSLNDADTLVIVTWPDPELPTPPAVLEAVQQAHRRGARIVSVCSGAFLLAEAGLLDGRRATTHWMYSDDLAARYPSIDVDPNVLFVDGGDGIFTSAGTAAGIDLCLHIVRLDHGAEVANTVARRMVVPPQRDGGQAQFVPSPVPPAPDDDTIAATIEWAMSHLDQPLQVDDLARRAMLSPRTFARRFGSVTGTTPMKWLARQRVLHAQRLLETTDLPIELVAQQCGFGTATVLRTHFRRVAGTSPLAYRRVFRCTDVDECASDASDASNLDLDAASATDADAGPVAVPA